MNKWASDDEDGQNLKVEVNVLSINDNFMTGIIVDFWTKYLRITVNSSET